MNYSTKSKLHSKFMFNFTVARQIKNLKVLKSQRCSFLDANSLQNSAWRVLTGVHQGRAQEGEVYCQSDLKMGIAPIKTNQLKISITKPDLFLQPYSNPHLSISLCQIVKLNDEYKIQIISNVLQQKIDNTELLVNVQLIQNQFSFLLIEFAGFQSSLSSVIAWTAVNLSAGNFDPFVDNLQLKQILQQHKLLDQESEFASLKWQNLLELRADQVNVFKKQKLSLDLFAGSVLDQSCVKIKQTVNLQIQHTDNTEQRLLHRLPVNFVCQKPFLNIMSHFNAVLCQFSFKKEKQLIFLLLRQKYQIDEFKIDFAEFDSFLEKFEAFYAEKLKKVGKRRGEVLAEQFLGFLGDFPGL
uniref:Uncharacterized protein n=1 Tax=Trepomonas sp. PC1 TaxID=1076344 RepID=A0A146KGM6_9EUKA|eukprot:JAP94409.1 Hypothetical protein TPC1_12949 [Trepomonas sp. PC1]